ncbi:hypothetical protein CNR22_20060 [Sphingobacteriaceae bacterium]|nr:hypothetical protein CNR22_20060 [Sphingobacteriaceae bacterium]
MNSALASIGKNLILVAIVFLSAFNFFYTWLNWKELLGVQSLVGLAYIFLSCYEYLNASYKASLPVQRYPYFTSKFIMFRSLKISIFVAFALLLYFSRSSVKLFYPICIIVAATEASILYLKYKKGLCFVNIYANYLLIVESKFTKVFASEIMIIEFRHDIFYFVKKNRKTVAIKLEHIRYRENFAQGINDWINRNNILVSAESKVKIAELI